MIDILDLYDERRELERLIHLYDDAMSSTNVAQRGQKEDEINQSELDRAVM